MLRERGNTSSVRKVVVDPRVSYELGKIRQLIPRVTYGTSFPANPKVGDLHYYSGDAKEGFTKDNWYAAKPDNGGWQSINAQSVSGENISGKIPTGVTIADYLSKFGGTMEGLISFVKDQILPAEMLKGKIPSGVTIEDYLSLYGGTMAGSIVLAGYNLLRVGQITGLDTSIKITTNPDGTLTLEAANELILQSALLTLIGTLVITGSVSITGDLTISGDLQVNGQQIGIASDSDLLTLATNLLTVNGGITLTGIIIHASDLHIQCGTDKTIVLDETVWRDLWVTVDPARVSGTTNAVMVGSIRELVFSNSDYADFPSIELSHDWKEGTTFYTHLHIATRGTNVNAYHVRYQIEYSMADINGVFPAPTTLDAEYTIPGGTAEFTHLFIPMGTIVGTGFHIGAQFKYRLVKVAAVSLDAPAANNPYVLQTGLHYEVDTVGSRQQATK